MKRFALLIAGAALLALPSVAEAANWQLGCADTTTPTDPQFRAATDRVKVEADGKVCYRLANTETVDSGEVAIIAESALICFDSDTGATAISTGVVTPRVCTGNSKPAANPTFTCLSLGTLTGLEGDASTQNACVRVGPGIYYLDVTTAMGAESRVKIQAENVKVP